MKGHILVGSNTSHPDVLKAQKLLNKISQKSMVPEDGALGKGTEDVIKQFQKECGFSPTGTVDKSLLAILEKASKIKKPEVEVVLNGKRYLFTKAEYANLLTQTAKKLAPGLIQLKSSVESARYLWDAHNKLNNDQYIVAWCIEVAAGVNLPKEGYIKNAEAAVAEAEKALKARDLKKFAAIFPKASKLADESRIKMRAYVSGVQEGGSNIVTGLEFIKVASFTVVAIIATPVAATTFGVGAIAAGAIAGASVAGVETLSTEVGKGVAGTSPGVKIAVKNVVVDTLIGGTVGAFVKGKYADKTLKAIVPALVKKLGPTLGKKMSQKGLERFLVNYFRKHGASILEGVISDTLDSCKSTNSPVTVKSFFESVVKNILTAGVFGKFDDAGALNAKAVFGLLDSKAKGELIKGFGSKKPSNKELEDLVGTLFADAMKSRGSAVYDKVYGNVTSGEPDKKKIKQQVVTELFDKKLLAKGVSLAKAKRK